MLAQDERLYLPRRELQLLRNRRTETRSVEHRAQAINLLRRQSDSLHRKLRQNVHWIGDHKDVSFLAETCGFDAVENLDEQSHVAINEIEP